jgi:hypothetical protein
MKTTTVKRLQVFVGKVCTVLTSSVCKQNFTDIQFPDFFVGVIDVIDEDGIFSKHPITGCVNFYPWGHIAGIFQEQVIEESDPRYEKVMEEMKSNPEKKSGVMPVDISKNEEIQFLDPESMAIIAEQAKEMQKTMVQKNA